MRGRGIVICAGGGTYFVNAWVCINMLRQHGCRLPIQLWFLGSREVDDSMRRLVEPLGVECVDASRVQKQRRFRRFEGWRLKSSALLHSPFREVLLLDADNVPVANPEYLFAAPQFRETGAVFWPDRGRLSAECPIWFICGVEYRDEPEFESGQILVNKVKCWNALNLAWHYNDHAELYYRFIYGDKDTFHLAFRKLDQRYAMPAVLPEMLAGTLCQHDFDGRRVFQHRGGHKWTLQGANPAVKGFWFEQDCLDHLNRLKALWPARSRAVISRDEPARARAYVRT